MSAKRRLTSKQRVLRKWPNSVAENVVICRGPDVGKWIWFIAHGYRDLGEGKTAALAWADAAKKI